MTIDVELPPDSHDVRSQAERFKNTCRYNGAAHYLAATRYQQRHIWLGIPATILATVVGSSIFASLSDPIKGKPGVVIAAGLLSIIAAVLSGLQTFFGYAILAETHKTAAAGYEVIRRDIDLFILSEWETRERVIAALSAILEKMADLDKASPAVPNWIYDQARRSIDSADRSVANEIVARR